MELLIIKLIAASLIGMAVKLKQKNDSLKDLAIKGNFQFPDTVWKFIIGERKMVGWSLLGMAFWQVVMGSIVHSTIHNSNNVAEPFLYGWVMIARKDVVTAVWLLLYTTIAYMGQDFLFSALSRTSKEVRAGIDYKTTIADKSTGTLDNPTPIVLPKKDGQV